MANTQVILSKANGDSMPAAQDKTWKKELFKPCWDQGGRFKKTNSGWLILHPNGTGSVTVHLSSSDHRALPNTKRFAVAAGFNV